MAMIFSLFLSQKLSHTQTWDKFDHNSEEVDLMVCQLNTSCDIFKQLGTALNFLSSGLPPSWDWKVTLPHRRIPQTQLSQMLRLCVVWTTTNTATRISPSNIAAASTAWTSLTNHLNVSNLKERGRGGGRQCWKSPSLRWKSKLVTNHASAFSERWTGKRV